MKLILLGTAAGGGFPQWNCRCPPCVSSRRDPATAHPRSQSSVAVSSDGVRWFLLNASPDVRRQLAAIPLDQPGVTRHVPFEGIVLTDGELDHTLGLPLLREARHLQLYATSEIEHILERASRLLPLTRAFADVRVTRLQPGVAIPLADRDGGESGLTVEAFTVAGHAPRFAGEAGPGQCIGVLIRDGAGTSCAYLPGCGALDEQLMGRLSEAAVVLFDGTFWQDDELIALGVGTRTARAMGHLPISGDEGSLRPLASLPGRVVYVHLNNTNPVLIEHSSERALVEAAGITIGYDGMELRT